MAKAVSQERQHERRKWLFLMLSPAISLFVVAIAQFVVHFVLAGSVYQSDSAELVQTMVNIVSFLVGIVAVVLLVLFPIWLVLYLKAGSDGRSKTTAIVLACIFGFWTWLYTYEKDSAKFWVNFALTLVTFGYWGVVAWIWAIIDTTIKPDEFYDKYKV